MQKPVPFRPDYSALRARAVGDFYRPAVALLMCEVNGAHMATVLKQHWPEQRDLNIRVKASVGPATMTDAGYASQLVGTTVADFPAVLSQASAVRALLPLGTQLTFGPYGAITAPQLIADGTSASFIEEGKAIPVRQYVIGTGPRLTPKKLASISVFNRELFEHSTPTIENTVRTVVSEDFGLGLDSKMLDATDADTTRPAGLRYGINAGSESANSTRSEAMAEDIATLVTGVASVAGNSPIAIIANPLQSAALKLWNNPRFDYPVLASAGLTAGTVVALATNCLVTAIDPVPRFDISREALLHMDTSAAAIDSGTTLTPIQSAPLKSLWQSDALALRTLVTCSWGLRSASGLAWLENVVW